MLAPPPILYKYFSPERVDTLGTGRVRFSRAHLLNDPFEMLPRFDVFVTEMIKEAEMKAFAFGPLSTEWRDITGLRKTPQRKAREHHFRVEQSAAFQRELGNRYGLLSFSESIDSPAMWGHYCRDHSGFAIAFDTSSPFFNARLMKITYREERSHLHDCATSDDEGFGVKNPEWCYEREWRVYEDFGEAAETNEDWKFESFPFDAIKHVYFGLRSSPMLVFEVKQAITNRLSVLPPFSRMKVHDSEFKLVAEQLNQNSEMPLDWSI